MQCQIHLTSIQDSTSYFHCPISAETRLSAFPHLPARESLFHAKEIQAAQFPYCLSEAEAPRSLVLAGKG